MSIQSITMTGAALPGIASDPGPAMTPPPWPRPNRTTSAGKPTMKRMLSDRWPTAAGIATMPVLMIIGILDDFAEGVVVAAVLYLAWGVLRRRPGQGGWVLWQVPGVLLFGAITVWALSLEHPQLQYALAVGWLGHAAWDVVHYRANRVVPRGGGRLSSQKTTGASP